MKEIALHTSLTDMQPVMYDVALKTCGYLTPETRIPCQALEKFATLQIQEKVVFYVNEKGQLFSFHFAHTLNLQHTICAIDYFPDHTQDQVVQAANQLLVAMKKYWQNGHRR